MANSTSPVVQTVLADMLAADAAKKATGANFSLATCGTLDSHSDGYVAYVRPVVSSVVRLCVTHLQAGRWVRSTTVRTLMTCCPLAGV